MAVTAKTLHPEGITVHSLSDSGTSQSVGLTSTMGKVYSVASQKGGTGKSSTSISLAAGLARRGERILLIDTDSQANSSKVLIPEYQSLKKEDTIYTTIIERQPLPILESSVPNLDIVASHILLSQTDITLTTAIDHRESRLKNALDMIKDRYAYVIIDCPPALSWLTINALTASDYIVVVISPGYFELESTIQITRTIGEVRGYFNPDLMLRGFLFTMNDPTINSKNSLLLLRQTYPEQVLNTVIPRNVDLKDANMAKQDIFSYDPSSKAALAYQQLIQELFS
jgi:chromosome partitioning protein